MEKQKYLVMYNFVPMDWDEGRYTLLPLEEGAVNELSSIAARVKSKYYYTEADKMPAYITYTFYGHSLACVTYGVPAWDLVIDKLDHEHRTEIVWLSESEFQVVRIGSDIHNVHVNPSGTIWFDSHIKNSDGMWASTSEYHINFIRESAGLPIVPLLGKHNSDLVISE